MTTIAARRAMRAGETSQAFYVWISLAMAAVFVGGLSHPTPWDFIDTPPLPMLLHVHGAIFTLWVFLFVAQPALIARGSVRLHRRVGWIGLGLAVAMVAMGVAATLFAIRNRLIPPFFPPTVFMVMNLIGILTFGGLVTAGLVMRRKRQWHKRLMLCATISILGPGLGRLLPMASFGAAAPLVMFGAILLFGVVAMAADLIARGRIHPAYFWGVGTILVTELAIGPLAFSPPAAELLRFIQSV
ncbi:hypothetical protein [Sphingomonas sp.]|uniref:hypothetical protein n=1 Tax=Sphingomonas sp. TaxID=28214 RepID=UPI00257AADE0|nr:hypothetical protein [Sphingomonas sp.]